MASFLFLLFFALAVTAWHAGKSAERRLVLEAVGRPLGARIKTGFWGGATGFACMIDGVEADLDAKSDGGRGWTRIRFYVRPEGRLELSREGLFSRLFHDEDLKLGDAAFDNDWLVYGFPERWVHGVLDPATRARIVRLSMRGSGLFSTSDLKVSAGPDCIEILVPRPLVDDEAELRGFLADATALFRKIRGVAEVPAGIAILGEARVALSGRCPLCEHALGTDVRTCAYCTTPHHSDCWDYFGGCTRYACGSRLSGDPRPSTTVRGR
jgi:hypothetical protein